MKPYIGYGQVTRFGTGSGNRAKTSCKPSLVESFALFAPVGIDQYPLSPVGRLILIDEERGLANPGGTDITVPDFVSVKG